MAGRKRIRGWFARVVLGIMMSAVAFVVERRLLRAIKRGGTKKDPLRDLAGSPRRTGVDLSSSAEDQVEDEREREQTP